jgi:hypothetical protein
MELMETSGTGHGRDVVENFMRDTHFGHPSPRHYTPIGESPTLTAPCQHAFGGGGTALWGGVRGGAEFECGALV